MSGSSSKEKILQAAERVVVRDGVGRLTLEAVAAEASLSKGGVLYHYPTKDELIRGMIDRLVRIFETRLEQARAAQSNPVGSRIRAYMDIAFRPPDEMATEINEVSSALLAAVVTNRSLLVPLQEHFDSWRHADDGTDPVTTAIIRLAAEGLWLGELFGINLVDSDMRSRVGERLRSYLQNSQP